MNGRRVDSLEALEHPGDYCVFYQQRQGVGPTISVLWFVMPTGDQGRIAAKGFGQKQTQTGLPEPEWEITENDEGVVTVQPSIDYPGRWYGHLTAGVWF